MIYHLSPVTINLIRRNGLLSFLQENIIKQSTEVDRPGVVCDQAGDGGLGDGAGQEDDLVAVEPGSESVVVT